MEEHLDNLLKKYLQTSSKLKRFERVVFRRFAPNVSDVLAEFNSLAKSFEELDLFQYSGMCYLGSAKCEKSLGSNVSETQYYLKSARTFAKGHREMEKLNFQHQQKDCLEGALKSYDMALSKLVSDSPLKVGIIREMQLLSKTFEMTSNFSSACHRINELESAASRDMSQGKYQSALEKLTDIFDNVKERKVEHLYSENLGRIEISCVLLLTLLNLPPSKHAPTHLKILEKYVVNYDYENDLNFCVDYGLSVEMNFALSDLIMSWNDRRQLKRAVENLLQFSCFSTDHRLLIDAIVEIVGK